MELHGHPERLEAFRRGDRDTLGALYVAYRDDVLKLLQRGFTFLSQGKPVRFQGFTEPFRCQELLQECFLRAFKQNAREAYDGARPWRPYLMAIARSQVIDHFRAERTQRRYFTPLHDAVPGAEHEHDALERLQRDAQSDPSPEASALAAELHAALESFLKTCSPEARRLIDEHLMGELSQAQMAEALGVTRNDVRREIKLLRAALLRHLKGSGLLGSLEIKDLLHALLALC